MAEASCRVSWFRSLSSRMRDASSTFAVDVSVACGIARVRAVDKLRTLTEFDPETIETLSL